MRMKVYDISQEVFGCAVYPGDPKPERKIVLKMSEGAVCNLSAFSMCAHNGTHVDAPLHFIGEGLRAEGPARRIRAHVLLRQCGYSRGFHFGEPELLHHEVTPAPSAPDSAR